MIFEQKDFIETGDIFSIAIGDFSSFLNEKLIKTIYIKSVFFFSIWTNRILSFCYQNWRSCSSE